MKPDQAVRTGATPAGIAEGERPDGDLRPDDRRRRTRTVVLAVVAIAFVLVAGLLLWLSPWPIPWPGRGGGAERGAGGPPPAVVTADEAERVVWNEEVIAVGTLDAVQGIDVTSELAGKVVAIRFDAGDKASEGQLLVELDTSTERAELDRIRAELAQARTNLGRRRALFDTGAIARADLDQMATETESLEAQAAAQEATIAKKRIRAPFAGELGIRRVDLGEYVSPGDAIVTLQQLAPIHANFTLPEALAGRVRAGQPVTVNVAAFPDQQFTGEVTAVDPLIAENTRAFAAQARLANEERRLRPGMFADVRLGLPGTRDVIVVPAAAVAYNAYGSSVFLARESDPVDLASGASPNAGSDGQGDGSPGPPQPTHVAERAFVATGERRGLLIAIEKGVQPGDLVVTAGQLKVDDGTPLIISEQDPYESVDPRPTEP